MSSASSHQRPVKHANSAYIQVPSTALDLDVYRPLNTPTQVAAGGKLKENTPLWSHSSSMGTTAPSATFNKRKNPELDGSTSDAPSVKKFKTATPGSQIGVNPLTGKPLVTSEDFPNGFAYCHQCNKKRDLRATIRCTEVVHYVTTKGKMPKVKQCRNKYCKACLKNRYNEDIEVVLKAQEVNHEHTPAFRCPKCRDICNCPRCRKAQGLEPLRVGKATSTAEAKSAVSFLSAASTTPEVAKVPLPALKWTGLCAGLSRQEAEDRMYIRETVLRFSSLMEPQIAKGNLDELDFIAGKSESSDEEEFVGWISEMALKAVLVGLVSLLADGEEPSSPIRTALKELKAAGANLNKLWKTMISLREEMAQNPSSTSQPAPFDYPDPSPPPALHSARATRSLVAASDSINVVATFQFIPVLISLIEHALATPLVRNELEQCGKERREWSKIGKDAQRRETERWEVIRKDLVAGADRETKAANKTKRQVHKNQLSRIEQSTKIVATSFRTRFAPLGTDDEGRVYYALTPSGSEREAGFEFLEAASQEKPSKLRKRCRILAHDVRSEVREWSWLIAVWGKRPGNAIADEESDEEDEEEEDEDGAAWWAFWEVEDINKLANHFAVNGGLEEDASPSPDDEEDGSSGSNAAQRRLRRFVSGLRGFASQLEWRITEDKYLATSAPS